MNIPSPLDFNEKDEFLAQLEVLKQHFAAMPPVLEVTLRDPSMQVEGYIVVHNTEISLKGALAGLEKQGCGKGGTRISADVTLDDVKMLAHKMALKNAASGLPLGGAKSGMRDDPDSEGFETRYKRFVQLAKSFLHENGGCFGGFGFDIGARRIHAEWACEALGSGKSFTGKPPHLGGTDYDREGIAGLGVAVAAQTAVSEQGKDIKGITFAVQGAGAMGAAVIRYFSEMGAQLCGLCDPRLGGYWTFNKPIAAELLKDLSEMNFEEAKSKLPDFADLHNALDEILYAPCDIIFPCALQNVVHVDNATKIKAAMIVEGANSPCTLEAYDIFKDRNILVIPDFMANAGGIIAAYTEMTVEVDNEKNAAEGIKAKIAKDKTRESISANIKEMLEIINKYDVRPVDAASYIALSRLFS
jgi:glutamate dehydrogenase (NAD(P)+)